MSTHVAKEWPNSLSSMLSPFFFLSQADSSSQGLWNISERAMERDIIPMCRHNGMSIGTASQALRYDLLTSRYVAPWGVLGQGRFKSPDELKSRSNLRGGDPPSDAELKLCQVLQGVAKELGGNISLANGKLWNSPWSRLLMRCSLVAMAWARQMMTDCYPILDGTSIEHLKENFEALKIKLSEEQMKKLSEASPFSPGFPTDNFGHDPRTLTGGVPNSATLNAVRVLVEEE